MGEDKSFSKAILPLRMAFEQKKAIYNYLEVHLYSRFGKDREKILKLLVDDDPIVKGPFLKFSLPFKAAEAAFKWPLAEELKPSFKPYLHQLKSFERLKDLQNTLVTTGTGSGKTECFAYPVLNYVLKKKKEDKHSGVKALILYPMNALIDDQAKRLSELAHVFSEKAGFSTPIRVGRYTGSGGNVKSMGESGQVIDHRGSLCANPPDILLTNYKMLDYMLLRKEEQKFWGVDTQKLFQFLVLDELHTFDGAQGADVAFLIRRLRLKLKGKSFTCVGTSATVAGGDQEKLLNFASELFGSSFEADSQIVEERLKLHEFLSEKKEATTAFPSEPFQDADFFKRGESAEYDDYEKALLKFFAAPLGTEKRAEWLKTHSAFKGIMKAFSEKNAHLSFDDLFDSFLGENAQVFSEGLGLSEKKDLFSRFIDLMSLSKNPERIKTALVNFNVQMWFEENMGLLKRLGGEGEFSKNRYSDNKDTNILPAIHCKECGLSGWATILKDHQYAAQSVDSFAYEDSTQKINGALRTNKAYFVFPFNSLKEDHKAYQYIFLEDRFYSHHSKIKDGVSGIPCVLRAQNGADLQDESFRFDVKEERKQGKKNSRCPSCNGSLSKIDRVYFSSSLLGSLVSQNFLSSATNPSDKKFLVFNDSVQDANHQAGYLGNRSATFNIRRFIFQNAPSEGTSFEEMLKELSNKFSELASKAKTDRTAKKLFSSLVSRQMWERFAELKLNSFDDYQLYCLRKSFELELYSALSTQSEVGWSLQNAGLMSFSLNDKTIELWKKALKNTILHQSAWSKSSLVERSEEFISGFVRQCIRRGAVKLPDFFLKDFKSSPYHDANDELNFWGLRREAPYLQKSLNWRNLPQALSLSNFRTKSGKRNLILLSERSWFAKCLVNFGLEKTDAAAFYGRFFEELSLLEGNGIEKISTAPDRFNFVLSPNHLELLKEERLATFKCQECSYESALSKSFESHPCLSSSCQGSLVRVEKREDLSRPLFLKDFYKTLPVSTLAESHTGGLSGEKRRLLEEVFKEGLLSGERSEELKGVYRASPVNILSCTPTLEMGIDIGSLSGVMLRGMPASLSQLLQRVGRSGRSSGNSYDVLVLSPKAHDQLRWSDQSLVFDSQVECPGVNFRHEPLVERQFMAFMLDQFVEDAKHPMISEGRFMESPFWLNFLEMFSESSKALLDQFFTALDSEEGKNKKHLEVVKKSILKKLSSKHYEKKLEKALHELDLKLNNIDRGVEANSKYISKEQEGNEEKENQTKVFIKKRKKLKDIPYFLSFLAEEAILPNYSFSKGAIELTASLRLSVSEERGSEKNRVYINKETSRPAAQGLLRLVPGGSDYSSGFKLSVSGVEDHSKNTVIANLCLHCASLEKTTHFLKKGKEEEILKEQLKTSLCKNCSTQTISLLVHELKNVRASSNFGDSQINDSEDAPVTSQQKVESFVSFAQDSADHFGRWSSKEAKVDFEFKENTSIVLLNRGDDLGANSDKKKEFHLCPECGAHGVLDKDGIVSYRNRTDSGQYYGISRHSFQCSHKNNDHFSESILMSFSSSFLSDAIRFPFYNKDLLPSIKAFLNFSIREHLGGDTSHINFVTQYSSTDSFVYLILYETVPGGTGHLRTLMDRLAGKDKKIPKNFLDFVQKGFEKLKNCCDKNGCPKCLLRKSNQWDYDKVRFHLIEEWVHSLLLAKDWAFAERHLQGKVTKAGAEDGETESMFTNTLRQKKSFLSGVVSFKDEGSLLNAVSGAKAKEEFSIKSAPTEKVSLKAGRYTKPDFHVFKNGEVAAYIYTDGAKFHINPDEDMSTFEEKDIDLRSSLSNEKGVPVLTFSYDMLQAWKNFRYILNMELESPLIVTKERKANFLQSFLFELAKGKTVKQECWNKLFSYFIFFSLGDLSSEGVSFKEKLDLKIVKALFEHISEKTKLEENVHFVNFSNGVFSLKTDKVSRSRESYKNFWALWWIMWCFDKSLVKVK